MKIFVFDHNYGGNIADGRALYKDDSLGEKGNSLAVNGQSVAVNGSSSVLNVRSPAVNEKWPAVYTKLETALMKDHKPFFVPDELGRIDAEVHVVARVSRLGKSMPLRFAHRYYEAVTLGVAFTARDMYAHLHDAGLPVDLSVGLDGSAAIGSWTQIAQLQPLSSLPFRLDIDGRTVQSGNTSQMKLSTDEAVSYIGRYVTLKMGDLIFTGCPSAPVTVKPEMHLEGWLGDEKVLDMYCK